MESSSLKTRQISFENRDNDRKSKSNRNKKRIFANQTSEENKSYATNARFNSTKTEPRRQFSLHSCLRDAQNKITLLLMRKVLLSLPFFAVTIPLGVYAAQINAPRVIIGRLFGKSDRLPVKNADVRTKGSHPSVTTTDSLGRFILCTPATTGDSLYVVASALGYEAQTFAVSQKDTGDSLRMGDLYLKNSDVMLSAAEVKAVLARMEQREDTTVFNAAAFRTAEGASLEALIKQLPGAEVAANGSIKVNGKTVKELLINGKDFFKGDTKMAMKNLPVNLVSKVKSYDKKSDLAEQTGIDDGEESFVLDISTKRELNQTLLSNVELGGGRDDDEHSNLYESKLMLMRFTDNSRFGLFGSHNNVGDRGFGGPRGFMSNNDGRTTSSMAGLDFSWDNGVKRFQSGAFEIGGNALYFRNDNKTESITASETFLTAGRKPSFSNAHRLSENLSQSLHSSLRLMWSPDSLTSVSFRPNFDWNKGNTNNQNRAATFNSDPFKTMNVGSTDEVLERAYGSTTRSESDTLVSTLPYLVNLNENNALGTSWSHAFNGDLTVTRKLPGRTGRSITAEVRGKWGQSGNTNYSLSNIHRRVNTSSQSTTPSTMLAPKGTHQFVDRPSTNWSYRVGASYVEPIVGKLFGEVRYAYEQRFTDGSRNLYHLSSLEGYSTLNNYAIANGNMPDALYKLRSEAVETQFDAAQLLDRLNRQDLYAATRDAVNSQTATYHHNRHRAEIGVRYNTSLINLNVGVRYMPELTRLDHTRGGIGHIDTTRMVQNIAPNFRLRIKFSKTKRLDIFYHGDTSQPSMTNLLNVVDNANPLHISVGNPGLKPSWSDNVRLFYNGYDSESQRGVMANLNFTNERNTVTQMMIYDDASGRQFTRPENINGNWSANGGFTFNTPLDASKMFTLSTSTNVNLSHSVGYVGTSAQTSGLSDAPSVQQVNQLFAEVVAQKSTNHISGFSEKLDLSLRRSKWDVTLDGRVSYQHSRASLNPHQNLDTWSYDYGLSSNVTLPWNISFSTDLRMTSRRGFSAAELNTNELIWNASLSKSFLKDNALTMRLEAFDLLNQENNISRTFTALMRTDTWSNKLNTYVMLHAILKLNVFGGAKLPSPPEGGAPGEGPSPRDHRGSGNFRPSMPPGGGRPKF